MSQKIILPRWKNSLPHGGAQLVESFLSTMAPGVEVEWAGNIVKRAGVGVAFGCEPTEDTREHLWSVAQSVMRLLPAREADLIPVKCKSRCMSMGDAEAAAKARWGNSEAMTPRYGAHE